MAKTNAKQKKTRKKVRRVVNDGIMHVYASFNNTIISVSDRAGNVLAFASAGAEGYRGARKSTPFAAQVAASRVSNLAKEEHSMKTVAVFVRGPGSGREAIREFMNHFKISEIRDNTGIPHNGCKPKKKRRV
jgi:small subunit ribosomal protein S11